MDDTPRRGPGRPRTGHAMVHLRIRVPTQLRDVLQHRAEARGVTMSDVARELLEQHVSETA